VIIHDTFATYAKGFLSLEALNAVGLSWLSVPMMSGIVSCSVQLFFAYRIWTLSRSKIMTVIIPTVALTQCGAALAAGAQALQIGEFNKLQSVAFVSTSIWLIGSAVCDILIAATMTYHLSRRRPDAYKSTKVLISRLIRMTVETGTITATVATLDVILFLAFRGATYHVAPATVLAKLYSNTCLAVLNSRMRIVGGRDEPNTEIIFSQTFVAQDGAASSEAKRYVNVRPTQNSNSHQESTWSDTIHMSRLDGTGLNHSDAGSAKELPIV